MQDEHGRAGQGAGPSKPVLILGWTAVPASGEDFREVATSARRATSPQEREARSRAAELVDRRAPPTLAGPHASRGARERSPS